MLRGLFRILEYRASAHLFVARGYSRPSLCSCSFISPMRCSPA
jgi:hypothetical protein